MKEASMPSNYQTLTMYDGYGVPIPHAKHWCNNILKAFYDARHPVPYEAVREQIWRDMGLTQEQIDCQTRTRVHRGVDVMADTAITMLIVMGLLKKAGEGLSTHCINPETFAPSKVYFYEITQEGIKIIETGRAIDDDFVAKLVSVHPGELKFKNLLFFWN